MIDTEAPETAAEIASSIPTRSSKWRIRLEALLYPAALFASISIWFLAIRAPLWLDETLSYWQVSGGFAKVWTRSALMPSSIGYLYTLWFAKSIFGSTELALKVPSLAALIAAVYFLFRMVQELFGRETAFLTCVFFSLEANIIFAATDARPYALALLAATVAGFSFIRWMRGRQVRQAALFGVAAAGVLYFHYLFASILPAFAVYYVVVRWRSIQADARQLRALIASFTLCCAPLIYRVASLYQTRQTHIVQEMRHPGLVVLNTLVPRQTLIGFVVVLFLAALVRKITIPRKDEVPPMLLGPLLALVPAAILITVSTVTPAHLLIPRYLTVASLGSALTWALLIMRIDSRWLRQIFCATLVVVTVVEFYQSPTSRKHELSFKSAHALVNSMVTPDEAPVLVCSAFIESNYEAMPTDRTSENPLLSQIDYYPIHAPIVMLPMTLNDETVRVAGPAIAKAAQRHRRFLAIAAPDSYKTLEWLASYTRGHFAGRIAGNFDDIVVAEFTPLEVD